MLKNKRFLTGYRLPAQRKYTSTESGNARANIEGQTPELYFLIQLNSTGFRFISSVLSIVIILTFVVSCRKSILKNNIPRYIITSPEIGEIVYLLQGSENVVGVTEEVDYPSVYAELPKVGRFGGVSIEKIIELNPTLVLTSSLEQEKLAEELRKIGIKTLTVYPKSINEMLNSIVIIADTMGIKERGRAVRDSLAAELNRRDESSQTKPRIYVEIYGHPIMSVSKRSFIGELVNLAGGINIFDTLPREYSRVKQEDVIGANPEIILLTYPGVTADDITGRKGWQNITACREGNIYSIDDVNPDLILRAGPRVVEGLKQLEIIFAKKKVEE